MADLNILVVEDESIEAMDIKRTLESIGYQVPYVASSGQEAIDKALELKPDLILMDIILKGEIDGIEAISKIKELSIPFIYLTAHSEESTIERAKLTEPSGYIIKPFDSTELKYAIELAIYKNKMETSLKNNEALFRAMVDSAPVAILVSVGVEEKVEFMNTQFTELFGYTLDDVPDVTHWWPLAYPDLEYRQKIEQVWTKRVEEALKYKTETEPVTADITCKDGTIKNVEVKLSSIGEKNLVFFTDLTHHKKVENELRHSNEWLSFSQKASKSGFWDWDMATGKLTWSPEFYELLGLATDLEPSFDTWLEILHPDDRNTAMERIDKAIKEHEFLINEYRVILPDGDEIWIRALGTTYYDKTNQPQRMSGICLDITKSRLEEEKHKKIELKYQSLFNNMLNGFAYCKMIYKDSKPFDFIYINVNKAFESLTGLKDVAGRKVSEVIPGIQKSDPELFEIYGRVASTGTSETFEMYLESLKEWFSVSVYSPQKGYFVAVFDVITIRKEAEERLKKSEERLKMGMSIANLAYWEYNVESDMFSFNDQFYTLYGTDKQQEGGYQMSSQKYAQRFIPPEEAKLVAEEIANALETDDPDYFSTVQHSIIRADGTKRFMIIRFIVVKDESGQTIKTIGVNQDITELKLAEEDLKISENRYRAVFENSGTPILTFNSQGTILMVNSEWERVSGYSRKEVEGKMTWIELVHPDYREMMIKYHQQRLKETDPVTNKYETAFVNKNGVKLFMYVTVVKVPGTDNWLASALDITDLKTTQKSLERNVLRFRALAENAIDGIITTDAHGNILYFNNSLMKIFGYNADELESSKLTRLMPERYRESFTESLKKFRTTGEHHLEGRTIETLGLKEDGTEFPFEMSLTKWEIEDEIYFTSIIRDITERKKAELALIKSEGLLRGVFDNMPNGMAVYHVRNDGSKGSDYIIKEFNHTSQEMEGMSREEVIGKSIFDIRPNIDDYGLIDVFRKVWGSGVPIHYPAKIYVDEKYANWYENYVFKTSTGEIVAIYNDVTEQQVAKEKIQKSLDEKEVLLREIHHRVQNNMQIISSLLNLQKQFVENAEADNVLFESQNRVKSLAMIHERLYQSHDLTHIDISAYIERLVADLFYSYNIPPEKVTRKIEIDDLRLNIETAVPCGIIISEIVSNSLKYAFPDGKEGELIVSLKASDEFNELIISDNGIGFPKELDFKNTKTLGLQLVYNLVKQLDGEITLDRSHGTKFRITFKELEYEKRI